MKAQQQHFGCESERGKLAGNVADQSRDVSGIIVIGRERAQARLPARLAQNLRRLVHHRCCRRSAILRVKRGEQNALCAFILQRLELIGDRRIAIAHRVFHKHAIAQPLLHSCRLITGNHSQRRAFVCPHLGIGARALFRARVEDDPAQDRLPHQLGNFDHARVGQKFRQIALYRARLGSLWRPQIDDEHADLSRLHGCVIAGQLLFNPSHAKGPLSPHRDA